MVEAVGVAELTLADVLARLRADVPDALLDWTQKSGGHQATMNVWMVNDLLDFRAPGWSEDVSVVPMDGYLEHVVRLTIVGSDGSVTRVGVGEGGADESDNPKTPGGMVTNGYAQAKKRAAAALGLGRKLWLVDKVRTPSRLGPNDRDKLVYRKRAWQYDVTVPVRYPSGREDATVGPEPEAVQGADEPADKPAAEPVTVQEGDSLDTKGAPLPDAPDEAVSDLVKIVGLEAGAGTALYHDSDNHVWTRPEGADSPSRTPSWVWSAKNKVIIDAKTGALIYDAETGDWPFLESKDEDGDGVIEWDAQDTSDDAAGSQSETWEPRLAGANTPDEVRANLSEIRALAQSNPRHADNVWPIYWKHLARTTGAAIGQANTTDRLRELAEVVDQIPDEAVREELKTKGAEAWRALTEPEGGNDDSK